MSALKYLQRAEELGFHPAFYDFATASIHAWRSKDTLIPGFERRGFFYTRSAAARAVAEWSQATDHV